MSHYAQIYAGEASGHDLMRCIELGRTGYLPTNVQQLSELVLTALQHPQFHGSLKAEIIQDTVMVMPVSCTVSDAPIQLEVCLHADTNDPHIIVLHGSCPSNYYNLIFHLHYLLTVLLAQSMHGRAVDDGVGDLELVDAASIKLHSTVKTTLFFRLLRWFIYYADRQIVKACPEFSPFYS